LGSKVSIIESGEGWPIVLVHGNFSNSHLWRGVIPHLEGLGRCVVPDLIGTGRSERIGKGPRSYRMDDQRTYFEAFMESLNLDTNVILVGIEWGASIAIDWAMRHESAIRGVAYMEMYLSGLSWRDFPHTLRDNLRVLRGDTEEALILDSDFVREKILPSLTLEPMTAAVAREYLLGFDLPGESRRAVATLVEEIPINGEPASVATWMERYDAWLQTSEIPKLRVLGKPGMVMNRKREERTRAFPNQVTAAVSGRHLLPEDDPDGVGEALAEWIWGLP
jgi:haloalkane dehalogenase